jgi:organic radical activating enzyme
VVRKDHAWRRYGQKELSLLSMKNLRKSELPARYNYVACFLVLDCNFDCDYCITNLKKREKLRGSLLSGQDWVRGLNRLELPEDLPVTLQGGEPSLHPDFIWIIKNLKPEIKIDILTNLSFDVDEFIKEIEPSRLKRDAPYPNIRVSYHPGFMKLEVLIQKVLCLSRAGFSIGVYGILHPELKEEVARAEKECQKHQIDFRTKEFLGECGGRLYGTYRYPDAVGSVKKKRCLCRTSELIIGPEGNIYRCHHDLYQDFPPIGNLLDPAFEIEDVFRECKEYGNCNPCDVNI